MSERDDIISMRHMLDYSRVSTGTRDKYAEIPWRQIVGMRNRLIHGYDVLDFDVLWNTVIEEIPPLIRELEKILGVER